MKNTSQLSSLNSNVIPLSPPSSLPPVLLKNTQQVTHKLPLPPLSPIQGEDLGDLVPIGKYSSKVHHIDPIPDLGTDTGSSEEILDPEYLIPTGSDFIVPTALDKLVGPTKVTEISSKTRRN